MNIKKTRKRRKKGIMKKGKYNKQWNRWNKEKHTKGKEREIKEKAGITYDKGKGRE